MRFSRTGTFLEDKIKNPARLKCILEKLKAAGKSIVFTNGCFDLIHYGHVKYLEEAKKKGDILVVALNSDSSIRKIKGKNRPLVNQKDRLRVVAALQSVDFVTLFHEDTPYKIIKRLSPDVLIKGADWKIKDIVGRDIVLARGGRVSTIKLTARRSTSNLINQIVKKFS
ncbi:MAG: D-glycero-beta-D-manno-heptose 1-phosphate adenylyltransferase [Candidatus Omnitrophica bacterium]|nr:D-glycero-beta-D-manno-heptose 1-phosphate adenylyltransferase [Candidatus Omnitrophota bacterium]